MKILKGGYELFSKFYPFLRSQQILYTPKELDELKTYPSEIIPGLLYLGNVYHGTQQYIRKDLKLKSYVSCTKADQAASYKNERNIDYFKVEIDDTPDATLTSYLKDVCLFIGDYKRNL